MNSRHRKMVRRLTSCVLVVLYLLVVTAANLFHTEVYNLRSDAADPYSQTKTNDPGINITAASSNQLRLSSMGDYCPVCAFLKTYQSQTSSSPDFISVNTPPVYILTAVDVFTPHKNPRPAIPLRGPPAVVL